MPVTRQRWKQPTQLPDDRWSVDATKILSRRELYAVLADLGA
jgi:hypothetical protein